MQLLMATLASPVVIKFSFITYYPLTGQLMNATQALANQVFLPKTNANHLCQAQAFIHFYNHCDLQVINPSTAMVCYYITFLAWHFTPSKELSGVRFLHRQLDVALEALASFLFACLRTPHPSGASTFYLACFINYVCWPPVSGC